MDYTLPATTYESPRPARRRPLNTIMEENQGKTDNNDIDEGTIIGRPSELDASLFVAVPREKKPDTRRHSVPLVESQGSEWNGQHPDFDDMYDVSDNETDMSDSCPSLRDSLSSRPTSYGTDATRYSMSSNRSSRNRYPTLHIPSSSVSSLTSPHKSSPIPPTPPPKIPVSPAVLKLLPSLVPALNATPSLDGSSVTSERVSNISAPVTPDMQTTIETADQWGRAPVRVQMDSEVAEDSISEEVVDSEVSIVIEESEDWRAALDSFPTISQEMRMNSAPYVVPQSEVSDETETATDNGVELPMDALDILRHLGADLESYRSDSPRSNLSQHEMREVGYEIDRPASVDRMTPATQVSGYSELSIPSPGGFFSSLDAGNQNPWATPAPLEPEVPTSAIAERFYNLPWDQPTNNVMEQIIEYDDGFTDGPPTARQAEFPVSLRDRHSTSDDDYIQETDRQEYDESYETELLQTAKANLDRTSVWLSAQTSYLAILQQPSGEESEQETEAKDDLETPQPRDSGIGLVSKKSVRFQENPVTKVDAIDEGPKRELVFYEGFQYMVDESSRLDAFVHQASRFDAIQASRIATTESHTNTLLGKYEITERWRPKYSGPFSQNPRQTGVFENNPAQLAYMRVEREQLALEQLEPVSWVVDAMKFLNGGRLLTSPASKRLAKAAKASQAGKKRRLRVLDLGGQGSCDWAWHCAYQYPDAQVITVTTEQQATNPDVDGPANHRTMPVPRLWQLPFKNDHFDVISARSLHSLLRSELDVSGTTSEFDMCLRECLRVLKPGGYFEYNVMDSSFARAGPRASAVSVEFGFNLRTRGYDPEPTRLFLSRLRRAQFVNTRSAWMFLPMGAETPDKKILRETPFPQCPSVTDLTNYEAVRGPVGSMTDVANVTGLLGGWMWEQWKVKLEKEMGREKSKWLEGFGDAVEESRDCGAGYRVLTGWTQKPLKRSN